MSNLLLTQQERDRFAAWLENEAATSKLLIEQMEKLGPHALPVLNLERTEMNAAIVIARKLRNTTSESIG